MNAVTARFAVERRLERYAGDRKARKLRAWINRTRVLTARNTQTEDSNEKGDRHISCRDGEEKSHDGSNDFLLLENLLGPATRVNHLSRGADITKGFTNRSTLLVYRTAGYRQGCINWTGEQIGWGVVRRAVMK